MGVGEKKKREERNKGTDGRGRQHLNRQGRQGRQERWRKEERGRRRPFRYLFIININYLLCGWTGSRYLGLVSVPVLGNGGITYYKGDPGVVMMWTGEIGWAIATQLGGWRKGEKIPFWGRAAQ